MSIVFASAASHAPGATAWPEAAGAEKLAAVTAGFQAIKDGLHASKPDVLLVLTSEHWANFFLDHVSAFCVGRAPSFSGPVEPWLKVPKQTFPGDPQFAVALLEHCYANGFEPSHAQELHFDHGTMVPLSFLAPPPQCRVVPIVFNTLAPPRATPRRCLELGRALRSFLNGRPERIAVIATGGMSHDPGEKRHGFIDTEFDAEFLRRVTQGDVQELSAYSDADLLAAGAGTLELLAWICLAGLMEGSKADVLVYEAVKPWATGIGMVAYDL